MTSPGGRAGHPAGTRAVVEERAGPGRGARTVAIAVGAGLALGVVTQIGQGVLPDGWRSLANSVSPWLFVAFLVGSRAARDPLAAVAGSLTLLFALVGYYGLVAIRFGIIPSLSGAVLLWLIASVAGGPVFGVAGRWWRDRRPWRRATALGLMGAAPIAEAAYFIVVLGFRDVGIAAALIGVLLPLLLGRERGDRVRGLLALVPCVLLGLAGFVATIALYGLLTSV